MPRVFFALWPGDEVREALLDWQARCLPRGARATHREDLHLTLHFLGQVPARQVRDLRVLGDNIHRSAFDLELDHLGVFPRARVLWGGLRETPSALLDLHEQLGDGLRELGIDLEARKYRPHVTLARKVSKLPRVTDPSPIAWHATHWALLESRPGSLPLYRPLAVWQLPEK